MKSLTRFKSKINWIALWVGIWVASGVFLFFGLIVLQGTGSSYMLKTVANISVQIGGSFFFALTVGWIVDKLRNIQGYSVLWEFSQEFGKGGVYTFYSDRKGRAETALEEAFETHRNGDVLIAGASLRFFLAPSGHLYERIKMMLGTKNNSVQLRVLFCNPSDNLELPIRSFVEEFNQDGTFSKHSPFDWKRKIAFSFKRFEENFFHEHGIHAEEDKKLRVIQDLESTRSGIKALKGISTHTPNTISHREIRSAPYCTVAIFPDKAFYTPNLLSTETPVNMPMIEFHKYSHVYLKLLEYFEFLWWVNDPNPEEGQKNV